MSNSSGNCSVYVYSTPAEQGLKAASLQALIDNPNSSQIARFSDYAIAHSFSARTAGASMILLGDDEQYWVCSMALAAGLEREGYQIVK